MRVYKPWMLTVYSPADRPVDDPSAGISRDGAAVDHVSASEGLDRLPLSSHESFDALLSPTVNDRIVPRRRRMPRYSQVVSWAKIGLPAIAVILAGLVVIWPQLEKVGEDAFSIGIAAMGRKGVNLEQVVNARFFGTDSDRQPYSVTADLAEETEPGSRVVRLDHPQADMTLNDGAWVMMAAQEGLYHQQQSQLELTDEVSLYHDKGYELHTQQAMIDFHAGTAHGETPVEAQGPFGTLESQGFRIDRAAQTVIFTGKARLVLRETSTISPLGSSSSSQSSTPRKDP